MTKRQPQRLYDAGDRRADGTPLAPAELQAHLAGPRVTAAVARLLSTLSEAEPAAQPARKVG